MKIKHYRKLAAGLFPAQFAPVFERAYTSKEVSLIADAIGIAARDANRREIEFIHSQARVQADVTLLEHKIQVLEEQFSKRFDVATVREPVVPQEEVFLAPTPPGRLGSP